MAQYIQIDALVAEIERRKEQIFIGIVEIPLTGRQKADATLEREVLGKVLNIINTIEVKEVDLEKEIQAFAKLYLYPIKVYDANVGISITMHQLYLCAKHFFELGLKTQKGE